MVSGTDRIEKEIVLKAPLERVWGALSDSQRFGTWFGVKFENAFTPGARIRGTIVPTQVDANVAKMMEPHTGLAFEFQIERLEPMRLFSYRWHPFALDPAVDYSIEPMTQVVFELEEVPGGTKLRITETGFDGLPLARRADAFEANEEGWELQTQLIEKYLALESG